MNHEPTLYAVVGTTHLPLMYLQHVLANFAITQCNKNLLMLFSTRVLNKWCQMEISIGFVLLSVFIKILHGVDYHKNVCLCLLHTFSLVSYKCFINAAIFSLVMIKEGSIYRFKQMQWIFSHKIASSS
jgi:hypothetical protein